MNLGIFTAMQKESQSFLSHAEGQCSVGDFVVYKIKLGEHTAHLCCPPNVGEIAAASACQLLISRFKAEAVLNFGIVGALTDSASVFSTVLVESVVHYDFDVSALDSLPVGRYVNFEDIAVPCDKTLLKLASEICTLPAVRCASADKFVADGKQKSLLNKQFGAEICDMESAGVLFTCKYNNVPCLLVKCISDSLNNALNDYEINSRAAAAGFFDFASKLADLL